MFDDLGELEYDLRKADAATIEVHIIYVVHMFCILK